MAPTRIADVIVPEVFNPYVVQRTAELSALQAAGIISNDAQLDALAASGGRLINMPFWNDLTGSDEVLSDTTALTPQNITAAQDVAALLMRGKAWAANDLAAALSGDDPMARIGDLVAAFWARQRQKTLISTLRGVFASASMAGNVHDIGTNTDANAADFDAASFIDAVQKLGDAKDRLTAVSMHSAVHSSLSKKDLIATERDSEGRFISTFMGHAVIVDDGHPVEVRDVDPTATVDNRNVYTSYIFGEGAIGLGNGAAPVPTETDRDSLAGDDILINRQHFVLHPRGAAFQSASVAGSSPTNAELEVAANWNRVYESKNIRIVAFRHQIT
jgi:hypothetical protein